ncbi:MAG: hypothetical protein CMK65_07610 [Pseudoalteromonas sp.]|uniref:DUF3732 domain-containing protein n=1 Tax=Pseudoalteromonas sp. TaxID=53249 RepID=UPI000C8A0535|nr:DUF3732 domain-containing protein [Pseudoalteromonas sp.]MAD03468.1 hypothetical protein [Pseudoalteromonas sp.]|tara:strand:- start:1202 stop:3112 length:1911 start_codon:yes stop_codon:yes gene_type:complete
MQIKVISLYGKNNKRRDVEFETSKLNIITGASKKGKTSLLDILDYCLGSKECDVAAGHIRNTVSWFSTLFQFENSQAFIARKAPILGAKSSVECMLLVGENIEIPEPDKIKSNTTIDSVIKFLSSKLGMPEYSTEIPDGQSRSSISLSFKHSKYFLFQSQDEIANKKVLFHRQSEPFIPQTIKDVLPFFLGAADDNRFSEMEKLRGLKRKRTVKVKELKEIESLKGSGLSKGFSLLAEAAQIGLYEGTTFNLSDEQLIAQFKHLSTWTPEDISGNTEGAPAINRLESEYRALKESKNIVNNMLKEAEDYEMAINGFENQEQEQGLRLETLNLYQKLETSDSPVKQVIQESLTKLNESLSKTTRAKPHLNSRIIELKSKRSEIAKSIKKAQAMLAEYQEKDEKLGKLQNLNLQKAKVLGRISLYLDGINWNRDTTVLEKKIKELTQRIENLEETLDPELLIEKLDSQLNLIGRDMSRWAKELKLEHSDHPIKLDLKRLTVVAETPDGKVPLYQMGSGENWVGYHLVTYMALAKWFTNRNRPVPNFVLFDQPTQVYFPTDIDVTGNIEEITVDEDRIAVKKMFKWLYDLIENEFENDFQIIVTDHADIDESWFQECVRDKKWRGKEALIPLSWIEQNS